MKKWIIIYSLLFLMAQILKSQLITDYSKDYGETRMQVILNTPNDISYEAALLDDDYKQYQPTLMNQILDVPNDSNKSIAAIGTTPNYEQLERLHIVDGAFWGKEACNDERNVAIISDQLAISLFGCEKAAKNIIHLDGKVYEIVGVYKKYTRIRDYVMDDGYEKIYVPITSALTKEAGTQFVSIDGTYLENMPDQQDLEKMGLGMNSSKISHDENWLKEVKSIGQLPMIILWLGFCFIGGRIIYCDIRKRWKPSCIEEGIKEAGEIVSYILFVCILCILAFRYFYIRTDALPQENIFDIGFYWKSLKAEWIRHNEFLIRGLSAFEQALYLLKLEMHIINIVQYGCLLKVSNMIRKDRKSRMKYREFKEEDRGESIC